MNQHSFTERLDHLISFGDSLIFVTSESSQGSAKIASEFVGSQPEFLEVIFLKGNNNEKSLYQRFSQQFCGISTTSVATQFVKECTQSDGALTAPNLWCFMQPEEMSSSFIKSILTLKQQLSQQKNYQLIIFCQANELARLKAIADGLSIQNVVMNSEDNNHSLDAVQPSALETLISENRAKLAERIQKREEQQASTTEPKKGKYQWVKWSVSSVIFFGVFLGILYGLYGDGSVAVTSELPESMVADTINTDEGQLSQRDGNTGGLSSSDARDAVVNDLAAETNDETRARRWDDAVNYIDKASESAINNELTEQQATASQDILVATQLEDELVKSTVEKDSDEYQTSHESDTENTASETIKESEPSQGSMLFPADRFVVQLAAMSNKEVLKSFILDNALSDKVWHYSAERKGETRYILLSAKVFTTAQLARDYIATLDKTTFLSAPFVRQTNVVNQEALSSVGEE